MERFDAFCTKCHAPIDYLSGNIPSADNYNVSEISEKGVSCDFCHTINASSGIGNGAFISSPGRIKRGPFNDSNYSTFHSTAYSDLHTRAEFCGMDENGYVDHDAVKYHTVFGDASGKHTEKVRKPVTITARLNYVSAPYILYNSTIL